MHKEPFVEHEKFFDCVHCGLCLASCPTYVELGTEMDSPRGRIVLLRALQEGRTDLNNEVVSHLDSCLGCRACETACPSGVQYGSLIEGARPFIEKHHTRPRVQRIKRWVINKTFSSVVGVRLLALLLRVGSVLGLSRFARFGQLPEKVRYWFGLLPERGEVSSEPLLDRYLPIGEKRYTVAVLSGCIMSAAFGSTNQSTVKVLRNNGCEVLVPKTQGCCGALLLHNGEKEEALGLARQNVDVFSKLDVDAVLINSAGCGAMMKEYGELLHQDPVYRDKAMKLTKKSRDIAEFLGDIELIPPTREIRARVTYHDACHLSHGQNVRSQPRKLLTAIPELELEELPESDWCCGSAGTYNLTQPEMAARLLKRKVRNISSTEADVVVTGNPGCLMRIRSGLKQNQSPIKAVHTIDLLAEAYE